MTGLSLVLWGCAKAKTQEDPDAAIIIGPPADARPGDEICDGEANDGDRFVDEGAGDLCGPIMNGTGACNGALGCSIGNCTEGYYDLDGDFGTGCECGVEPGEDKLTACEDAIDLGSFADTDTGIELVGNLVPEGDVDLYRFVAVDTADTVCDNFHVRAQFLENPGEAYIVDVWKDGCAGTQICDGSTDMQWYTNFSAGGLGECPCGPADINHCDDDTSEFVVRVRRADGAPVTCDSYRLEISNGRYAAP